MKKTLAVLGVFTAAAVATNATLKIMQRTGGSIAGVGFIAGSEVARPLRFLFKPVSLTK